MTGQLEFPISPPTWCWVCGRICPVRPYGCGPECQEETSE